MQQSSPLFDNDYDHPSNTAPTLPRKNSQPKRSKSFQDSSRSRPYYGDSQDRQVTDRQTTDRQQSGKYEFVSDYLQMPCVAASHPTPSNGVKRSHSAALDPGILREPDKRDRSQTTSPSHSQSGRCKAPLDSQDPDYRSSCTMTPTAAKRPRSRGDIVTRDLIEPRDHQCLSHGRPLSRNRMRYPQQRAYSDSEAENLSEGYYHENYDNRGSYRKQSRSRDRRERRLPPPPGPEDFNTRYYKLPYNIPLENRHGDSDYIEGNGHRCDHRMAHCQHAKLDNRTFRPYPAIHYDPLNSFYQNNSETTENEYYTPTTPRSLKLSKKLRTSNSESSSTPANISPWTCHNTILAPKYSSSLKMSTISTGDKQLNKLKCRSNVSQVWHDPLMGQDKRDATYTGNDGSHTSETKGMEETFAEFTIDVTLNYLRYVWNSSELIRKLIWGALFLGFFIYSFMCCFRSFTIYVDRPTSTKYNMYFEPSKLVRFPTITICNMNPHDKIYLEQDANKPMKYFLYKEFKTPWSENLTEPTSQAMKHFDVRNYYRNSGMKLEDFIESATFLEDKVEVSETFQEHFTTHGMCWTFNSNGSRKVNRTGMDFGLSFGINIKQDLYPDFVTTAGVKVMFHNFYEPALIDEYGMALAPGTENFVSLSYERIKNLGSPFGNCSSVPPARFSRYSVSGCERQCLINAMIRDCGCRSYYLTGKRDGSAAADKECTLFDESVCVEEVIQRYHRGYYTGSEGCVCQDACLSENYKATLSTAEYPAKNYGQALELYNEAKAKAEGNGDVQIRNVTFYRENFLKVHIYFEILSIKEVEKVASYKWSNLMGDVGGQLGLFLGANIVTIFEFLDFYLRLLWYKSIALYAAYKIAQKRQKSEQPV